jgi:hypothetical protein
MQTNYSKEPDFDFWWKQFFVGLYLRRTLDYQYPSPQKDIVNKK